MDTNALEIVNILQGMPALVGLGLLKAWAMMALVGLIAYFMIDRI